LGGDRFSSVACVPRTSSGVMTRVRARTDRISVSSASAAAASNGAAIVNPWLVSTSATVDALLSIWMNSGRCRGCASLHVAMARSAETNVR
jgi:hypothetical protein